MRPVILLWILCCSVVVAAIKQPKFFGRRDYGAFQPFVVVADVNGDQVPDMITVSPTIQTWFGNGLGAFNPGPSTRTVWLGAGGGVATDLNSDGKIDLVIAGQNENGVWGIGVCFGNGDGTFQQPVFYQFGSSYLTTWVALGDFNGDGILDAVIGGTTGVWIYNGKGGGAFGSGVRLTTLGASRQNIAVADFNADGHLDLAFITSRGFAILFGNGNGTFQAPVNYATPSLPQWIAASDLNHDGHLDIALAAPTANSVYVYLNKGQGLFSAPSTVALACEQIAIGDVNGDGIPDLVSSLGYISFGLGKALFAPPVYYPVESPGGFPSWNVVLADLRQTGLTDILFGENGAVSVLLNSGTGKFEDGVWTALPGAGNCGAAADFNGDGKPDLAVPTSTGVTILFGTGKASAPYTIGPSFAVSGATCPITGDLNGDGIPDLVLGANGLGGVGAYLGKGDGTFTLANVIPMSPGFLVLGDFNHDGILDVADSSNQFALGKGDGTFQAVQLIVSNPPPLGSSWIAAGDVNNDGWTDLLAVQYQFAFSDMYVILNDHNGGFTLSSTIAVVGGPESVMVADLNRDGNLDAVVQTQDNAQVYLGNGQGGFTLSATLGYATPDTLPAEIGDVNGDGILDILLPTDGSVGIALGKGDGTFISGPTVGVGPAEGQILLENLHGQTKPGVPDLIEPDGTGGVTVLINLTR